MLRVIILEDEPLIAELLEAKILKADPSISIVSVLSSIKDGIKFLEKSKSIDLIFSDIELSDGLSFEIFKHTQNKIPIIFCTAYNHYAQEAFKAQGIDYVLKPYGTDEIKEAINRFKANLGHNHQQNLDLAIDLIKQNTGRKKNTILIFKGEEIIPLKTSEIAIAGLDAGRVYVHTYNMQSYPINQNLETLEDLLSEDFYRLNRQFLIHRKAVRKVSQYFDRKLFIHPSIEFSEKLIVSKGKATDFLKWLEVH